MHHKSRLYLFGSYEAVVEAAMAVRRMDDLRGLTSSGVKAIPDCAAGMHEFVGFSDSSGRGLRSVCSELSKSHWTLVVGCSVLGIGFRDIQPDQCIWGAAAYVDGAELLGGLTGSLGSSLPPDIRAKVDNSNSAGALPQSCLPDLHQLAYSRTRAEAAGRLQSAIAARNGSNPRAGFHRWSPLTHAVSAQGLDGFAQRLRTSSLDGAPATWAKKLTHEAVAARKDGVASWVDALLCGSRTSDDAHVQSDHDPLSDGDVRHWQFNRYALLRALGQAPESDQLANALIESLSSPLVSLQSDQHALPYLVSADGVDAGAGGIAAAGLRRLISAAGVNSDEYREDHRNQAVAAVARAGFSADSLRLAMRMGTSPGLLTSKLLLSPGSPEGVKSLASSRLLDGLCALYGCINVFPEELTRAFVDAGGPAFGVFDARRTAALMGSIIQEAVGARDGGTEPAQPTRRRNSV